MCGDGCARNVWNIGPGVSLDDMKYGDVVVYENRKRMVVNTYGNFFLNTAEEGNNDTVLSQNLMGYDVRTGKFQCDTTQETNLSDYCPEMGYDLNIAMRETRL